MQPMRIGKDELFNPAMWRRGLRRVDWSKVTRVRSRNLPFGNRVLLLELRDGRASKGPLGSLHAPEDFKADVVSHVAGS